MRMRAIPIALGLAAVLTGCAPTALQLASIALDGVAYVATGKGTGDLALSAVTGGDCRMANAMKGGDVCKAPAAKREAEIAAAALPEVPPRLATALAPMPGAAEIAAAAAVEPAAGRVVMPRIVMHESAGMNVAEVTGTAPGSSLTAHLDHAGTLHIFLVAPDGQTTDRALFTVPGYARAPGAFTGVLIGTRFMAPDSFLR